MGAGVKKSKAKKMQAKAAEQTTRKVKGRNKVAKMSRADKPKRAASEAETPRGKPSGDSYIRGGPTRAKSDVAAGPKGPRRVERAAPPGGGGAARLRSTPGAVPRRLSRPAPRGACRRPARANRSRTRKA